MSSAIIYLVVTITVFLSLFIHSTKADWTIHLTSPSCSFSGTPTSGTVGTPSTINVTGSEVAPPAGHNITTRLTYPTTSGTATYSDPDASLSYSWSTFGLAATSYTLTAEVTDNAGNRGSCTHTITLSLAPTPTNTPIPPTSIPTPTSTPAPLAPTVPSCTLNTDVCLNGPWYDPSEVLRVSWTNPAGRNPVSYVDISTSSSFSTYYNRGVLGLTTSATPPRGFRLWSDPWYDSNPYIAIYPNTTYYVRTYNGLHSSTVTCPQASVCPTPGPYSPPTVTLNVGCLGSNTSANIGTVSSPIVGTIQSTPGGNVLIDTVSISYTTTTPTGQKSYTYKKPASAGGTSIADGYTGVSWNPVDAPSGLVIVPERTYQVNLCNNAGPCTTASSSFIVHTCYCNSGIVCSGPCSAPVNSCAPTTGLRSCTYTTFSGGGSCIQINAPSQSCSLTCTSPAQCYSGICLIPTSTPINTPTPTNIPTPTNTPAPTTRPWLKTSGGDVHQDK